MYLSENPDINVVSVNEHWLESDEIQFLKIENFVVSNFYCRKNKECGGVLLLTKKNLLFERIQIIDDLCIENSFEICSTLLSKSGVLFVSIYRSPSPTETVFIDQLNKLLKIVNHLKYTTFIAGDYNINIKLNNKSTKIFQDTIGCFNFRFSTIEDTRVTATTNSCIDNILISCNMPYDSTITEPYLSDHYGVSLQLPAAYFYHEENPDHTYTKCDTNKAKQILGTTDWTLVLTGQAQEVFTKFHDIIVRTLNNCMRTNTVKNNNNVQGHPWYNDSLKNLKEEIEILRTIEKCLPSATVHEKLKETKRFYKSQLIKSRIDYNDNKILCALNQPREIWKIINKTSKKTEKCIITELSAEEFQTYFTSTVNDVLNKIPDTGDDYLTMLHNKTTQSNKSLFFTPVTSEEIKSIIRAMNKSRSKDIYSLNIAYIIEILDEILDPLVHIINACLSEGTFPTELKLARVSPIHKKGDINDPGKYRPISNIPVIAKIMESVLKARLFSFLSPDFCTTQFGFLPKRSTIQAISNIVNDIHKAFEAGEMIDAIFADLSKAFDSVNHAKLLSKLYYYGVRGIALDMFTSYLTNRRQIISFNGKLSRTEKVSSGVPQGSILGPLLFVVYINDLPSNITTADTYLYADDTTFIGRDLNNREAMEEAEKWFQCNNLLLNEGKTETLTFNHRLYLEDNHVKFLGVYLEPNLSWKTHIEHLAGTLRKHIYLIRKIKEIASLHVVKTAYSAYILSAIRYGILLWGNSSESARIFILQKKAVRIMADIGQIESCRGWFRRLGILTVPSLYVESCLLHVKEHEHEYVKQDSIHNHNTKFKGNIQIPFVRLAHTQKSFHYQSIKLFNKLPSPIRLLPSKIFKCRIKRILLQAELYKIDDFFELDMDRLCRDIHI